MADLADELLADLGSEEDAQYAGVDGSSGEVASASSSSSTIALCKRKAVEDADLDDLEALEGDAGTDEEDGEGNGGVLDGSGKGTNSNSKNAVKAAEEMDHDEIEQLDLGPTSINSVHAVCKALRSSRLQDTLSQIHQFGTLDTPDFEGVLEETPEYSLIVRANNLAVELDNEIMMAHKFIRDHYAPRFPELETLILNPWEFVQAVQALGNTEDMSKANLEGILPHGTIVVISMTASTTNGRPLEPKAWERVEEACQVVFDLEAARRKILTYVESRMTLIAPNLSAVVGTRVATKLLGVAGGLTALGKIPASNIGLLGAPKRSATAATGLSTAFSGRHNGFIAQSDLVESTPEEYRRQAQRMVSAKAVLAARMDGAKSMRDGSYGRKLYDELERKLEKLQEPPPSKMIKALPRPQEGGRKQRRGGRAARKMKEKYGMTELRKMQNRVEFGKAEEEAGAFDDILGMGMINSASTGRVRAQVADSKSRAKMSKRNINRLAALRGPTSSSLSAASALDSATSGTASSLSFTPVQGIELVDPSRNKTKVDEANAKWFKEGAFSMLPNAGTGSKIPGLSASASGAASSASASASRVMGPPPVPSKKTES
ncbi:Nop domain-containing protein [Tilletiaria anomala UBC 951]|uniref:Nop domain-containing protein n=1 Tax=Tilletiaria anomala (strain ATCC 24038 / CBS 436.72 / UBC 951) TaxID=1037660 RepID=A0A066VJM7_TILAU|nr:Nop domain-containing protein [Tilletiaria anomala UBC 951]KDN40513.1 Nop domain-containing protein [Tilletiaria anomala UBC 951]